MSLLVHLGMWGGLFVVPLAGLQPSDSAMGDPELLEQHYSLADMCWVVGWWWVAVGWSLAFVYYCLYPACKAWRSKAAGGSDGLA